MKTLGPGQHKSFGSIGRALGGAIVREAGRLIPVILISMTLYQTPAHSQIVIRRDTTFTGTMAFTQAVVVSDSTVAVTIQQANITFEQGMLVEWGRLVVYNSVITFRNGVGLSLTRSANLLAYGDCHFNGDTTCGIGLIQSNGTIENCIFYNVNVGAQSGRPGTPETERTFTLANCEIRWPLDHPSPLISGGGNIYIYDCDLIRTGTGSIGQNYNIQINGKYSTIRNCRLFKGGIFVNNGSMTNSDMEISDVTISDARVGITGPGIRRIQRNLIRNVDIGIDGGTASSRWMGALIRHNDIFNIAERAINVVGDSIVINENRFKGNDATAKGILFGYSTGRITDNLLSHFRISESSIDVDGIALYVRNQLAGQNRSVDVIGNVIEYCGLSAMADRSIVASVVYLESPGNFVSNEIRQCTLGGRYSPTNSFAGGPVLDIVFPRNVGLPLTVNHNLIHSNHFEATGVYQPTNTRGTLVAASFENRRLEFRGNHLYGTPDRSLGVALFPTGFPGGLVGDSLMFEYNCMKNHRVGVGTMYAPNLSLHNVLKWNTQYHIMRYGGYILPVMYAMQNNWDSADSATIDSKLYDNEEWSQNGTIDFTGYYSNTYVINISVPTGLRFDIGDSLEVSVRVTTLQAVPVADVPVFLSCNDADVARFKLRSPVTNGNGQVTAMLYGVQGGSTSIRAFAGDTTSNPVQVQVRGSTGVDQSNAKHQPDGWKLEQNYPNPFNPTTEIRYQIPEVSHVTLKVFDILGREVATLVNEVQEVGFRSVQFDASNLASGVYLYRLQADAFVEAKKLILLR